MCIGAADSQRAHAGTARRATARPLQEPVGDLEWAAREVALGIRLSKVQGGRDLPMVQYEHGLDQSGDPGGSVQVADVGLDRADGAEALLAGAKPIGPGESGDL